ncbi:hypothetical protein CHS0354_001919 [Potamilus streckersoni]|uniref:Uncharacterized protein n=1 Tax=Potamilus streckersoni TaxID=2493646 RepID=A0AAE0SB20_9BIVA|nr:hypothetical protein CHS0354_001919 [Potamilus streckersoni]
MSSYMLATRKSAYHENCIPATQRVTAPPIETKRPEGDFNKCDKVTLDKIWKQSVDGEKRCVKNWETNWGFLADYDSKGNKKEAEELPDQVQMFSKDVPNTNSGNYGSRQDTPLGQTMRNLEYKFYSDGRRRKMGADMICY